MLHGSERFLTSPLSCPHSERGKDSSSPPPVTPKACWAVGNSEPPSGDAVGRTLRPAPTRKQKCFHFLVCHLPSDKEERKGFPLTWSHHTPKLGSRCPKHKSINQTLSATSSKKEAEPEATGKGTSPSTCGGLLLWFLQRDWCRNLAPINSAVTSEVKVLWTKSGCGKPVA